MHLFFRNLLAVQIYVRARGDAVGFEQEMRSGAGGKSKCRAVEPWDLELGDICLLEICGVEDGGVGVHIIGEESGHKCSMRVNGIPRRCVETRRG